MNDQTLPWESDAPRSVAERVASATARRIIEGGLEPGELLTEVGLAERSGSSRTPMREAILQLETWGLVRVLPKKGALVTAVPPAERRDLLDLRSMWEIHAVETLGARRDAPARDTVIAELRAALDAQDAALDRHDLLAFAAHDFAFHMRIISAGGNGVISDLLDLLGPRFARLTYAAVCEGAAAAGGFRSEHEHLIELIAVGDVAAFADEIRAHIDAAYFAANR